MGRRCVMALAALLLFSGLILAHADEDVSVDVSDEDEGPAKTVEEVADAGPFLLARKFIPGKDLVQGRNSTVAVELFNAGDSPAMDVVVTDTNAWDTNFVKVSGLRDVEKIDRIPVGQTARVEFFITPIQIGYGIASPARVTYKGEDTSSRVAYTTPLPLSIISPYQLRMREALRWGSYLTLGSFTTLQHWRNAAIISTLVALAAFGFWVYSNISQTRKQRIYQKALAEVEKMK